MSILENKLREYFTKQYQMNYDDEDENPFYINRPEELNGGNNVEGMIENIITGGMASRKWLELSKKKSKEDNDNNKNKNIRKIDNKDDDSIDYTDSDSEKYLRNDSDDNSDVAIDDKDIKNHPDDDYSSDSDSVKLFDDVDSDESSNSNQLLNLDNDVSESSVDEIGDDDPDFKVFVETNDDVDIVDISSTDSDDDSDDDSNDGSEIGSDDDDDDIKAYIQKIINGGLKTETVKIITKFPYIVEDE